jgi:hypothetical protein
MSQPHTLVAVTGAQQDADMLRSFKSNASTTSGRSRFSNGGFSLTDTHIPRNGMISTTSTEAVLLTALGSRKVKVSHILKMGDPTRNRDVDLMESFVEGRRRRARERERIPAENLEGMKPQRYCSERNCVIS